LRLVRARPYAVHAARPDHRTRQRRQGGAPCSRGCARGAARAAARRADGGGRRALPARAGRGRARVRGQCRDVLPLASEIGRAAGVRGRPLGRVARDRVVRAAIADVSLAGAVARSAGRRGPFAGALGGLIRRAAAQPLVTVTPQALHHVTQAQRGVGRCGPPGARTTRPGAGRAPTSAYRGRLEALGRHDSDGYAWAALLDALRAAPVELGRAGRVPVRVRRPLARCSSTRWRRWPQPRRRPRSAFAAAPTSRGGSRSAGGPRRSKQLARPAGRRGSSRASGPAPSITPRARATALHHLERFLFEPEAPRREPNGAVGCWRPAASGRRPSSSAPRCSS
jgi:hypothetical protein